MSMVRVTIDGQQAEVAEGSSALDALRSVGLDVPTACNDERLAPSAACRLCLVRLNGQPKPIASCAYKVKEGDTLEVDSPDLHVYRRGVLSMLAKNYPDEYIQALPEKTFHHWLNHYGLKGECPAEGRAEVDSTNPYFRFDPSACIECFRCVRICSEVQGSNVWQIVERGPETHVIPDSMGELAQSTCKSCGACADACPTGALVDKTRLQSKPDKWTRTVCPYCGLGCELMAGTQGDKIVQVRPALDAPVNKGHLCVKGRYAHQYVHSPDRLTQPLIRKDGILVSASWDEAITLVAEKFQTIKDQHGPNAIGVLGSARATNEDNYVTQKFARVVLGTNNVDCCARVCHAPTAAAMRALLGTGAATNSYDDVDVAKTIFLCGCNPSRNHPVMGERIKQAVRRGAKLMVADPRRIELAEMADVYLPIKVGTNIPMLNTLAHIVIRDGLVDEEFMRARVDGMDEFFAEVSQWTPERGAEVCGIDADLLVKAAHLYAGGRPTMSFHGLGMTEHHQGTESIMALVNLALIAGNIGRPGAGVNPLRGQNNVQGSAHMGCEPKNLPGFVSIQDGRARAEEIWHATLSEEPGLNLMQMLDAAREGSLKAIWTIGYDVLHTNPNMSASREAYGKMDFVVVQDLFLNATAEEYAHVVLPACSSFEREGTFMNAERRVQLLRIVLPMLGESKPDWQIIQTVAQAMGHTEGFTFQNAEEIWEEVRLLWKPGAGISYERLRKKGLQWPCPTEDHPGTTILHKDKFTYGERTTLKPIPFVPTPEQTNAEFPFILNSGRTLYHFNAGTMTGRTKNLELDSTDWLEMHPEDAAQLGLEDGACVQVTSRYGSVRLPLTVGTQVRKGEVFATFHSPKVFLNELTGPTRDRVVSSPEYKVTAVKIERA